MSLIQPSPVPSVPIDVISPEAATVVEIESTTDKQGSQSTPPGIPNPVAETTSAEVTTPVVLPQSVASLPVLPQPTGSVADLLEPSAQPVSPHPAIAVEMPPKRAALPSLNPSEVLDVVESPVAKKLVAQTRDGDTQEFIITPGQEDVNDPLENDPEASQDNDTDAATEPEIIEDVSEELIPPELVELVSDQQEYDASQQVVIATGNVTMRFANGLLLADRLRINLTDRFAVAEGNVTLERGEQILQGQRFEYFFVLDRGVIFDANGEIFQPSTAQDFNPILPNDPASAILPNQTLNERLAVNQPISNVVGQEGFQTSVGASAPGVESVSPVPGSGGQVNRIRFQAEQVNFDADGWTAQQVRLTNDPFSPPELEVQAETADYYNVAPEVDEIKLTGSRVLLDQRVSLPFQDRLTIDQRDRQPGVLSIGYDGDDRGGLYVQAGFTPIDTDSVRFQVKPQYLLQKVAFPNAFPTANESDSEVCALCPSAFGLITELDAQFSNRTSLINTLNFSNLNLGNLDTSLRARLELQNKLGPLNNPHDLRVGYNYRERLFNGSLGFQTVNSSLGAVLVSPRYVLGDPFSTLTYQASIQNVEAETDNRNLIGSNADDNLVTLMRYQGAATLSKNFLLWSGKQLPSTAEGGLKYTSRPVTPYLVFQTGLTGVSSFYSDGSTQPSLTGTVGFVGQVGNFSKPYLDFTGFRVGFSQGIRGDQSPFFFDRFTDRQVVTAGLTQQVYGPLRIGVQSSYSITASEEISTDYFIEYSRRTHNIQVRFNPILQVGSINLRISDFNWSGNPGTFDGSDIRPVIQGVIR